MVCKIDRLNPTTREAIESMILNEGFYMKTPKPLSIPQISYISYVYYRTKLDHKTLYKHMYLCMGLPRLNRKTNRRAQIAEYWRLKNKVA